MINKIIFYLLFGISILNKFYGTARIKSEANKVHLPNFIVDVIQPNLDLVFILGCAWLIQKFIKVFIFKENN